MDGKEEDIVIEYWRKFYTTNHCTLCGDTGILDTTGVTTLTGTEVGRRNYCICPNGQGRRARNKDEGVV